MFHESKFLILQHFVNELLQFFFSASHGIGRILSQCKSDDIEEEPMHPMRFQIHINNSTIILPRSSEGDDLIGFTTSKLILSNSYEECSWPNPHLCEEDGDFEFSPDDNHDPSNYFNISEITYLIPLIRTMIHTQIIFLTLSPLMNLGYLE